MYFLIYFNHFKILIIYIITSVQMCTPVIIHYVTYLLLSQQISHLSDTKHSYENIINYIPYAELYIEKTFL